LSAGKTGAGDFEVAVLSGLHAGACTRLGERSHTVIGRDMACDLMLRDDSVADRHLMLVLLDGKVSAVELDGAVEVDDLPLQQGKTVALRRGAKIKLGQVLLGVGIPGTDWSQHDAFSRVSRAGRIGIFIQRWLGHSPRRRHGVKIFVFILAGACVVASLLFPIYQWSQQKRLQDVSPEALARQLGLRLAPMRFADISITVDNASGNVIVGGYVPLDEDLRRIELVILSTKIRPFMRLFSSERIGIEAKEYLGRHLPGAQVKLAAADTVSIGFADPLQPKFKTWLQKEMLRDIPGLRKVLFSGPSHSAFAEVAPEPFSILSNGPQRFLVDGDGARFFPGSELSKGVYLKWVGTETVSVERKEGNSH
jgi:hypothetical protein